MTIYSVDKSRTYADELQRFNDNPDKQYRDNLTGKYKTKGWERAVLDLREKKMPPYPTTKIKPK